MPAINKIFRDQSNKPKVSLFTLAFRAADSALTWAGVLGLGFEFEVALELLRVSSSILLLLAVARLLRTSGVFAEKMTIILKVARFQKNQN